MRENRYPPPVGRAVNQSLSFSAGCELRCRRLAYGTRDAKEREFNYVRSRSQPDADLRWVAALSVETRRESLCHA